MNICFLATSLNLSFCNINRFQLGCVDYESQMYCHSNSTNLMIFVTELIIRLNLLFAYCNPNLPKGESQTNDNTSLIKRYPVIVLYHNSLHHSKQDIQKSRDYLIGRY